MKNWRKFDPRRNGLKVIFSTREPRKRRREKRTLQPRKRREGRVLSFGRERSSN